ncbi:hypothetical protein QBC39DRAFT_338878 [Podospora conica]|nr:hypothetical protein QBC39DRAFT_338878 [Schizothecium conicum]
MKISSRIDGICGAILLPRPSATWSAAAEALTRVARPGRATQHGPGARNRHYSLVRTFTCGASLSRLGANPRLLGDSVCPLLKVSTSTSRKASLHDGTFFRSSIPNCCETHTAAAHAPEHEPEPEHPQEDAHDESATEERVDERARYTKQELLDLVDSYDGEEIGPVDEYLQFFRDPYMRGYAAPSDPNVTISLNKEDTDYPLPDEVTPAGSKESEDLWDLRFAVASRLRNPEAVSLDYIYEVYSRLPEPRIPYLSGRLRHQLLKTLAQPHTKNARSMLRYFAVIGDIRNCGLALTPPEWNSAMSFASRYVGVATETETEAALKIWRDMEVEAGIPATDVTFNILFDVASKAGNFTLAEMIYREMESRGHRFNRYHHVSLIHFFGLKMDTAGLRAAYAEMVHAGEMIDTVVLNAVIAGLLRSGEDDAAERVYERMKASVEGKAALPVRSYSTDRAITRALMMFARLGRQFPELRPRLQQASPLHPDLRTYTILINHHGVAAGNLARVARYVDDMKHFAIPLHGTVFLALFKGFARHGGPGRHGGRSAWSAQRLESIWHAFVAALDDETPGLEIKTWLGLWILQAFGRCSTTESVLDAYDALKARWRLDREEEEFMADFLASVLKRKGVKNGQI